MEPAVLAERLREAAESVGFEVRTGPASAEGGLVRLRGRAVVFVPEDALPAGRVGILAGALSTMDLEGVFLLPAVREAIDRARAALQDGAG